MKLLFDENLSPRLVTILAEAYPDSQHVDAIGLRDAPDRSIWERARSDGFVIGARNEASHAGLTPLA